mmetsp:Transcript_9406/g.15736  ORF Transcript_9406/g.15736 Transcript_9406/m.15736 type:complete len:708 (-) Transcript_9406:150-2273(-)
MGGHYQSEGAASDANTGTYLDLSGCEAQPQEVSRGIAGRSIMSRSRSVLFILGLVGALLFYLDGSFHVAGVKRGVSIVQADLQGRSTPLISVSNEYPKLKNLDMYGFDAEVVEPHRVTYLRIIDDGTSSLSKSYSWTVTDENKNQIEVIPLDTGQSEVSVIFTVAGQFYTIEAKDNSTSQSSSLTITQKVICKYVRRELRALHYEDREKFRHALRIFHTMPTVEGKAEYGGDFFNYRDSSMLHLAFKGYDAESDGDVCSPWHKGMGFFTGHWGMVRMAEKVLQLIDPSIAMPYYDYVLDSEKYGADFQTLSAVFTDDYMGAYEPSSNTEVKPLGGFWAALPTPQVIQDDVPHTAAAAAAAYGWVPELSADWGQHHNQHGMITEFYNPDDSEYVVRTGATCGRRIETLKMPGCAPSTLALKQSSLTGAYSVMFGALHTNMHFFLAGAWNCSVDTAAALEPGGMLSVGKSSKVPSDFMKLAVDSILVSIVNIWKELYLDGNYISEAELSKSSPPQLSCGLQIDSLNDAEVYAYLASNYSLFTTFESIGDYQMDISYAKLFKKTNGTFVFKEADESEDKALKRFLLKQACTASPISPFATPLGSSADPMFFPVHSYWMKYFARMALTATPDFDWSWDTRETDCWGHGEWDAPGWTDAGLRADGGGSGLRMKNREIMEFFNPSNPRLPYVHDHLEFSCLTGDSEDPPPLSH